MNKVNESFLIELVYSLSLTSFLRLENANNQNGAETKDKFDLEKFKFYLNQLNEYNTIGTSSFNRSASIDTPHSMKYQQTQDSVKYL